MTDDQLTLSLFSFGLVVWVFRFLKAGEMIKEKPQKRDIWQQLKILDQLSNLISWNNNHKIDPHQNHHSMKSHMTRFHSERTREPVFSTLQHKKTPMFHTIFDLSWHVGLSFQPPRGGTQWTCQLLRRKRRFEWSNGYTFPLQVHRRWHRSRGVGGIELKDV